MEKTLKEINLAKEVKKLHIDVENLQEQCKLLQKRLDFLQDETVKIAVEKQSLIVSVSYILAIAAEVAKKEGVKIVDLSTIDPQGPSPEGRLPERKDQQHYR